MGHYSSATDGVWGHNNREAELDFTHRATHVTAAIGKEIAAIFYGTSPRRSYFEGCSTGGRQGLLAAQRFPDDFDGIIAGAPVINETGAGMQLLWSVLAARGPDGEPVLEPTHLQLLHADVLRQCDTLDGLKDGILDDPRVCRIDFSPLRCVAANQGLCLTDEQIARVRRIYDGPRDGRGRALYTGGAMPGSELNWIDTYTAARGTTPSYYHFIGDLFRYLAFAEDPGSTWQPEQFDFDRDPQRLGFMEQLFTASNPDLRRFKQRGGKLIIYQGWNDQSVVPLNIIDYYEIATRALGGPTNTLPFARLYLVPGMNHCGGGSGATEFDYLSALEAWVERDQAPEALLGSRVVEGVMVKQRAVLPYPRQNRYRGGDPARPESYTEKANRKPAAKLSSKPE
jgi:feruloyl esterase